MGMVVGFGLVFFGFLTPFVAALMVGHVRNTRRGMLMVVGWVVILLLLAILFGLDGLVWLLGVLGLVCSCLCVGAALIMLLFGMPIRDIFGVLRGHRRVS